LFCHNLFSSPLIQNRISVSAPNFHFVRHFKYFTSLRPGCLSVCPTSARKQGDNKSSQP
jgi:hypothetical protein